MSFKATAMSVDFQQWGMQPRMARSAQVGIWMIKVTKLPNSLSFNLLT